ncbi:WhiB family transcriptional regulator [Streptomyces sp. NPDC051987]|uniref:WhiB family transcriptional regulator n=1 Tax=Streptomyces sp. NPDC051987 TaxID=3155808 RepID=UPI003438F903
MTSLAPVPCRLDPDLWFSPDPVDRHYAVRQCRTACPLLLACMRRHATSTERHGVWGGIDMEERAARLRSAPTGAQPLPTAT